jgi:hypothetical protein
VAICSAVLENGRVTLFYNSPLAVRAKHAVHVVHAVCMLRTWYVVHAVRAMDCSCAVGPVYGACAA